MLSFLLLVHTFLLASASDLLSRQRRAWIIDSFTIEEGHPGPFPYMLGRIKLDRAYVIKFEISGQGVDEEPKGILSIQKETGILFVHKTVDYEETKVLKLKLVATRADQTLDTRLGVEISILDINDNPPRFQRDVYEITIGEDQAQGVRLLAVMAYDRDKPGSLNATFHYEIESVSPNPPDAEFFLDEIGALSFRGCLDYEVGDKYTILLLAKDHGEVVQLSSTTTALIHIQDGNNYPPIITGQSGTGIVRESVTGSSPLRLHVTDRDSQHSPAWKAIYTIHGDEAGRFQINTDPDTNDGILTVVKPLDFEEAAETELSISVENEVPRFSCEVKERPPSGLWVVDTVGEEAARGGASARVTIRVEDVNDPPAFTAAAYEATLRENVAIGTSVATVTAVDPDSSHARDIVYALARDPDGWLDVDPVTGLITTAKSPDRESLHVVDNVYTAVLHAVDNGDPPMTGTATLLLHVIDQNDNVPQLTVNHVNMCVGDGPTLTNITALDRDNTPFGGPLRFELLGDSKGKWTVDPSYGYTVNLMRESSVYSGLHTVDLKISDMQGQFAIHNLSVVVCDCTVTPDCLERRSSVVAVDSGAIAVMLFSPLVLLFVLLLAFFVTCKKEFSSKFDFAHEETLLSSNIEKLGTDCKIPDIPVMSTGKQKYPSQLLQWPVDGQYAEKSTKTVDESFSYEDTRDFGIETIYNGSSTKDQDQTTKSYRYRPQSRFMSDVDVSALLLQRLSTVQTTEDDLGDPNPHLYAEEGVEDACYDLEKIFISEDLLDHRQLEDLGPRFNHLASICKPLQAHP